jgi:hypothetical protein
MTPPPAGTRITAVVKNQPERGFVVSYIAEQISVYLDAQYKSGKFGAPHIFLLKDEGITWARGWGQSTAVLMAAYTLAGSNW